MGYIRGGGSASLKGLRQFLNAFSQELHSYLLRATLVVSHIQNHSLNMLGVSFPSFWVFPRRRSTVDAEVAYLESLEAGNFDEPLYVRRKELGLSDW